MERKYKTAGILKDLLGELTDTSESSIYEPLEFKKPLKGVSIRKETNVFIRFEDIEKFEALGQIELYKENESLFT